MLKHHDGSMRTPEVNEVAGAKHLLQRVYLQVRDAAGLLQQAACDSAQGPPTACNIKSYSDVARGQDWQQGFAAPCEMYLHAP